MFTWRLQFLLKNDAPFRCRTGTRTYRHMRGIIYITENVITFLSHNVFGDDICCIRNAPESKRHIMEGHRVIQVKNNPKRKISHKYIAHLISVFYVGGIFHKKYLFEENSLNMPEWGENLYGLVKWIWDMRQQCAVKWLWLLVHNTVWPNTAIIIRVFVTKNEKVPIIHFQIVQIWRKIEEIYESLKICFQAYIYLPYYFSCIMLWLFA